MALERDSATSQIVQGQGRILEALADDDAVFEGTLGRLGPQFGLTPEELRTCLREMVRVGWIFVRTAPFGHVTFRLERRAIDASRPAALERRRGVANTWRL